MANLETTDRNDAAAFIKATGAGTDGDPHIIEHLETNSADIETAVQASAASLVSILAELLLQGTDLNTLAADPATQTTLAALLTELQAKADLAETQPVSAAALPLPTGGSTSALQTSSEALLTTIDTDTSALAGTVAGSEQQVDVVAELPAGTQNIGDVDVASIAAGDNNIGNVDIASALPAGTNAIGKLAANSGVDIGDVDVLSIAAGSNTIGATEDGGATWTQVFGVSGVGFTSADASTAAAVTDAPTGGQKLVIDDIIFSVDTAMQVDFEIETAGSIFFTCHCAANVLYQITPRGKFKMPTADKKLMVDTDAAGNISVLAFYHSEA